MSAFIRLGPGKTGGPLGIPPELASDVQLSGNMQQVLLKAVDGLVVGGKSDGELTSVVEANQTVLIRPASPLAPKRFDTLVGINPELILRGDVSCPVLILPGRGQDIVCRFTARKKTDLKELDYLFIFSMVE